MYKIYLRDDVPREQMRTALQGYSVLTLDIGYFSTRLRPGSSITVTDDVYARLCPQLDRAACAVIVTHIPDVVAVTPSAPSPSVADEETVVSAAPVEESPVAVPEEPELANVPEPVEAASAVNGADGEVETDIEDGEPSDEQPAQKKRGGRRGRRSGS